MVSENEAEILSRIKQEQELKKSVENSPEGRIKRLEELLKEQQLKSQKKEEELLIQMADQAEENVKSRRSEQEALQEAKIAKYKYLNQQKAEISGIANLNNFEEEKDPERMSRKIFLEQLRASRIKSEEEARKKTDNVYYL